MQPTPEQIADKEKESDAAAADLVKKEEEEEEQTRVIHYPLYIVPHCHSHALSYSSLCTQG